MYSPKYHYAEKRVFIVCRYQASRPIYIRCLMDDSLILTLKIAGRPLRLIVRISNSSPLRALLELVNGITKNVTI